MVCTFSLTSLEIIEAMCDDDNPFTYSSHRFTYSMSFSTLLATSAAEFNFWPGINDSTGIHAGILYLLIPLILVCANAFKIEVRLNYSLGKFDTSVESVLTIFKIYGMLEVLTGGIKLLCLAIIVCALIAINRGGEYLLILLLYVTSWCFLSQMTDTSFEKLEREMVLHLVSNVSQIAPMAIMIPC